MELCAMRDKKSMHVGNRVFFSQEKIIYGSTKRGLLKLSEFSIINRL